MLVFAAFVFSDEEPSAMVQFEGGPCSVISPVQAYILKNLLFSNGTTTADWRKISGIYIFAYFIAKSRRL